VTVIRQHAGLSPERWASFSFAQQILMIGNEMNRGLHHLNTGDVERVRATYERALALVDLTVGLPLAHARRRELLRWRDLIGVLYLDDDPSVEMHAEAFRCLLRMTPESSRQIAELPGLTVTR
jgi:hypothetical protein